MRPIRLHDTRSGSVVALEPRSGNAVGIYACGPTVYNRIHIGNARPFVVFSLLRRFLAVSGYDPTLVVNVTDVNDKIYDAASAQGVGSAELAARMTEAYRAFHSAKSSGDSLRSALSTSSPWLMSSVRRCESEP
jgi:cysteinyl-tRNA synthetase